MGLSKVFVPSTPPALSPALSKLLDQRAREGEWRVRRNAPPLPAPLAQELDQRIDAIQAQLLPLTLEETKRNTLELLSALNLVVANPLADEMLAVRADLTALALENMPRLAWGTGALKRLMRACRFLPTPADMHAQLMKETAQPYAQLSRLKIMQIETRLNARRAAPSLLAPDFATTPTKTEQETRS